MSNAWDDMRKAKEDEYFAKKNREAMERLAKKKSAEEPRLSPVSKKPMKQEVLMGIAVDRCEQTGGIWLDAGELEQLFSQMKELKADDQGSSVFASFFKGLVGNK